MIVVVEGPSAAGKTTWISLQQGMPVVDEYRSSGSEPVEEASEDDHAAFWAEVNAQRWKKAEALEREHGIVICDSDPFKLHYVWTRWRIGDATRAEWDANVRAFRSEFEAGRLGLADATLVSIPDEDTLRQRRDEDRSRRRRNFDLHLRLAGPLQEWYCAVDRLEPGHVLWHHPDAHLSALELRRRRTRTGVELFGELVASLPD